MPREKAGRGRTGHGETRFVGACQCAGTAAHERQARRRVVTVGRRGLEPASDMRLLTAHKILIGASLALALLLTARSASIYAATHANTELAFVVAGFLLAIALGFYLRALWHR
jgi:hypothetical protein